MASGSGLTQLPKEEECAFTEKEVDFMDYKKVSQLPRSPHRCSEKFMASGSGLTLLPKEEECAFTEKEDDFVDYNKKVPQLSQSPHSSSQIELSLKGNSEFTALPPSFFRRMALLQVLDLSHTSIKKLPKSLPKLVSLKSLLLRGCELFMELSPPVGKLTNLEELDLDETEIMDLPIEIGKLAKLRQLRVSFYQTCCKQKSKWNVLIHPETISILSQLTELSIDVNPADKRWDDLVEAVVEEVCKSMTLRTLKLYLPKFQLLDNLSWIYPSLPYFRFMVGHHKRRIIHRIPHEVEAEFRNWDKCLKFVNGENIPVEIQGVLKYSTSFFLDHHSTARSLSDFGVENMRRLRFCLLTECDNMETIIDAENVKEGDPSSLENGLMKSLEYMYFYYMDSLTSVWRGPKGFGCVPKLKILALHTCPRLINIFCHSILENFVYLEELILEDCPLVTSLVYNTSVNPLMSDKFLPNLKRLLLLYLPQLVTIWNGLPIAPKLESIGFYNCPKLKSISKMEFSSKSLKIIKGESQWWEDMNWDASEWGNRPDYLMQIFSPINHEQDVMTQMAEDRDHLNCVEDMNWDETDWKPILSPIPDEHQLSCISCSDYMEDKITETDVIKPIPSECTFPYTTDVLEQEWSFSSEKNMSLKDNEFDVTLKICEIDNDEDEPKAKRWNSIQNEIKSFNIELADTFHRDSLLNYFSERNQSLNSSKESASKASSVDVSKKSGKKLIRSYESPCAACKFLRRKCVPDCFFAPYFPADEPQKFANIHKIFGTSNVCKLLIDLPTHQREDAVDSLAYEAETRLRDPVHGCIGVISLLQKRVLELQKKLKAANADSCNEIPAAFPACPGASSVEGMKHGFIGGKYDKKPIQVQMAEDRDHLHCVEDMNWDETDWKPILSPIPDERQLSCISCSAGGRLGNLYCDPLMASAGHKITARQRWTPTPVQLQILERIFDQGTRTPSKQKIKEITSELSQHGQISETNVYNWFQNTRARSNRKQLIASSNNAESEVETEVESPNEKKTKPENLLSQQNPAPRADDMCFQNHPGITSELHFLGALSNINSYNVAGDEHLSGKMEMSGSYDIYDQAEDYRDYSMAR